MKDHVVGKEHHLRLRYRSSGRVVRTCPRLPSSPHQALYVLYLRQNVCGEVSNFPRGVELTLSLSPLFLLFLSFLLLLVGGSRVLTKFQTSLVDKIVRTKLCDGRVDTEVSAGAQDGYLDCGVGGLLDLVYKLKGWFSKSCLVLLKSKVEVL